MSDRAIAVFNLGLIIPHLWGKILLSTLYNLHEIILWGFPVQLARPDTTLGSLRISGNVSFYPFRRFWTVFLVWLFVSASNLSLANSYVEILAPRGDGISGWGIWEVPKSWEWNSSEGNYCLIREVLESFLGEGNAPHSSTLARKIPWMEEPGRLQSMGLLRIGHYWATSLSLFIFTHWRRKWQPTPVFLPWESQGRGSLVGCHLWGRPGSDTTEVT